MVLKVALVALSVWATSASPASPERSLRGDAQASGSNSTRPLVAKKGLPSSTLGANHSLSPENLTGYLLDGFHHVAKALGMEAAFNRTAVPPPRPKAKAENGMRSGHNCLCIFDIDRTITGKQGDLASCPGNKVVGGNDDAYGGGEVTLSQLGQHVGTTWCSRECHVRGISAHHRARPNIPVPQNILSCNRGCKARRARRMARRLGIDSGNVYMFDDKASNVLPFRGTGMNAHQVSCHSRDGNHGLCGGTTVELKRLSGVTTC